MAIKNRNLLESFNRAASGIIYCLRTQRNFRIHVFAAGAVLLLSLWFRLSKWEFLLVLAAIFLVLITEVINTAIEATIDLITDRYHPLAATAKNLAAGAVILAAVFAVLTGYIVFFPKLDPLIPKVVYAVADSPVYLSLVALLLVFLAVLFLKTRTGRGLPFSGDAQRPYGAGVCHHHHHCFTQQQRLGHGAGFVHGFPLGGEQGGDGDPFAG